MSMNAIKSAQPINNMYAVSISNMIINELKRKLNVNAATLGSTGKKPDDTYSGDIDIAVEMELSKENVDKLKNFLITSFKLNMTDTPEFRELPGLNILSVGFHYEYGILREPMVVQIDFMFTDNLEFSKFIFHSPDYRKNESNFKGLYRTNLLVKIVDFIPYDGEDRQGNGAKYDFEGNCTDYWKYTLSFSKGLKRTHKSYISPKTGKLLKNPYTVKEDDKIISKNPEDIITFLFGKNVKIKDFNSFESIIKFMFSDRFKYRVQMRDMIMDFINDPRHEEKRSELIKYITTMVMKHFDDDMAGYSLEALLLIYNKDSYMDIINRVKSEFEK